jgi:hypothetical protein
MNIHELVLRRNRFYQTVVHWQFILTILILTGIYFNYLFIRKVSAQSVLPVYFMTDKYGYYLADQPLTEPLYHDDQIALWANDHVLDILQLNYISYTKTLNRAAKFFNPIGYVNYMKALNQSRNISALLAHQYKTIGEIIEPLKVTRTFTERGRFSWVLKGKFMMHYINTKNVNNPFDQELDLTVLVVRESLYLYEEGISLMTVIA